MSRKHGKAMNWDRVHRDRIPDRAWSRAGDDGWRPSAASRGRARMLRVSPTGVQLRIPRRRVLA